jgi:hypothetical protein
MGDALLPATRGAGPLLQRDYWAVFADCTRTPSELIREVKMHFGELAPRTLVEFSAPEGLVKDAILDILIRPAQRCGVRVIHEDDQSVTLGTLDGHPEAGRITFGAYRNDAGEVVFHIRSRARSAGTLKRLGFLAIGEAMQTNTWTDFIKSTAVLVGACISDAIHADTQDVDEVPEDEAPLESPTFLAVGD